LIDPRLVDLGSTLIYVGHWCNDAYDPKKTSHALLYTQVDANGNRL